MLSPWQYLATDLPTRRGLLTSSGGRAGLHGVMCYGPPLLSWRAGPKVAWVGGQGTAFTVVAEKESSLFKFQNNNIYKQAWSFAYNVR